MKIEKIEIAGKRVMPVTNASGIVFNDPFTAARLACRIKELGMVTLKSTGLNERVMPTEALLESNPLGLEFGCREPTFVQLGDGTYVNAVKLINDGAEKTREKIERAGIPKDRIIISSVFAENEGKLEQIVRILAPVVDIIEWNGGCPHGERVGISQGQDPKVIYSFGKTIAAATNKPFIIKLPYDFTKECVLAAKESGAYGAAAINTVPCEPLGENGKHLLWNKRGGKSGKEIKDIGLQRVREIREVAGKDFFIIGMGGIYFSRGIKDYIENGANAVALGSVLTGMDDDGIARFIPTIVRDVEQGTSNAEKLLPRVNITRIPVRIRKIDGRDCDFKIYQTTTSLDALPGQFVFAGLYEEGDFRGEEKPFSIMDTDPLTIGVLSRGLFTKKFNSLREGDSFYVRGPYGKGVDVPRGSDVTLVAGGCGIGGLSFPAKRFSQMGNRVITLIGAKDKKHLAYLDRFERYGEVHVATEEGDYGVKGMVSSLLDSIDIPTRGYFFNCGPRAMVEAILQREIDMSSADKVFSAIEYLTMCGVGVCGKCVDSKGRRTCVEGPFMPAV